MSHDDGWRFIVLGRTLERVDMTVRLLSTRLGDAWGTDGWVAIAALLRGVRVVPPHVPPRRRRAPRGRVPAARPAVSAFGVPRAERRRRACLYDLDPGSAAAAPGASRAGSSAGPCAELEFVRADELEASLAEHLGRLERGARTAHDAIADRFFHALDRDPVERLMTWRLVGRARHRPTSTSVTCSRRTTRPDSRPARETASSCSTIVSR